MKNLWRLLPLIFFLASSPLFGTADKMDFSKTNLVIRGQLVRAELAVTQSEQVKGLMFRSHLPENQGMLFVYSSEKEACMWMKNTVIPLSVAFIDETFRIINIARMKPLTRQSHCAEAPASFALEMNFGWFRKHSVVPGDLIQGLSKQVKKNG